MNSPYVLNFYGLRQYSLIYVVFSTFFALLTQDEQVECVSRMAQHLKPGGSFVVEAFVPDMTRFVDGQATRTTLVGVNKLRLTAAMIDKVNQLITGHNVILGEQGVRLYPVKIRYAWPTELDLMARLAGLQLHQRWADWSGTAFSSDSKQHISVYQRRADT